MNIKKIINKIIIIRKITLLYNNLTVSDIFGDTTKNKPSNTNSVAFTCGFLYIQDNNLDDSILI